MNQLWKYSIVIKYFLYEINVYINNNSSVYCNIDVNNSFSFSQTKVKYLLTFKLKELLISKLKYTLELPFQFDFISYKRHSLLINSQFTVNP